MTIRLGVIMDPIGAINPKKDTTLTLLLAAQAMGWELHYMEMPDLSLRDGHASGESDGSDGDLLDHGESSA